MSSRIIYLKIIERNTYLRHILMNVKQREVYPKTKTRFKDYIEGSGQTETRVYRGTIRMGMVSINLIVMSSDAERKTLKYTLCGDYVYACGKGGESIFLLICLPRLPRGASPRGGCEIWIKVSGRVTLPGSNSPAAFYNCVLSLNMYRFAPRACSPGFGRPPSPLTSSLYPWPDNRTARTITKNICFKDCTPRDRYIVAAIIFSREPNRDSARTTHGKSLENRRIGRE